jgi:hypothetical protein
MKDTANVTTTPSIPTNSVLNAIAEPALSKLALIIKDGLGVWKKCIRMTTCRKTNSLVTYQMKKDHTFLSVLSLIDKI